MPELAQRLANLSQGKLRLLNRLLDSHAAGVPPREETSYGKQLVAFVVPERGHSVNAEELRAFLKKQLPQYMIPASVNVLDSMPLTPNGKIDRKRLASSPQQAGLEPAVPRDAPANQTEQALMRIWAEVLGVERVGPEDNFFDIGGHSLLATQVVSRVRELLRVELPLQLIFDEPTLAGLASAIELIRSLTQEATDAREAFGEREELEL